MAEFGLDLGRTWTPATETIVWELRMPRVLTAMVVGAALAVAGATFQGLIRNPLADPYVLGTASGAALGAAIAVVLPINIMVIEFGCSMASLSRAHCSPRSSSSGWRRRIGGLTRLLLTGYAVGSILAALLTMAMYMSGQNLREIFSYLLGGLGGSSWIRLAVATPIVLAACSSSRARPGPRRAAARRHRGRPSRDRCPQGARHPARDGSDGDRRGGRDQRADRVRRPRRAPRRAAGRRPGRAPRVPLSALVGATLLAAADLVARLVGDIPVGVVMALLGAPFFLVLLYRSRTGYEL